MKRFMGTLMMSSFLFFGLNAFAAAPLAADGAKTDEASNARCWAWTDCWSGRRISCWATGDACRYSYVKGVSVTCYGETYGGAYAYHTEYCY